MDTQTTLQQIKDQIKEYCEARDWDQYHNAKDLAIGIITEASELLEHFRFKDKSEFEPFFKNKEKREQISDEIIDVIYFAFRLAQKYDIDISTEFKRKMLKNAERYPIENVKGSNKSFKER